MLVLGVGNILLGDDDVGVHVVRRLARDLGARSWLALVDGATSGFRLLGTLAAFNRVLVVDAADLGEPAGTIDVRWFQACLFIGAARMVCLSKRPVSAHAFSPSTARPNVGPAQDPFQTSTRTGLDQRIVRRIV